MRIQGPSEKCFSALWDYRLVTIVADSALHNEADKGATHRNLELLSGSSAAGTGEGDCQIYTPPYPVIGKSDRQKSLEIDF